MGMPKATDESGVIEEYLKVLGVRIFHNLRMVLIDVLSGGCISNEWKQSRVVLVHKEEALKNYGFVASCL